MSENDPENDNMTTTEEEEPPAMPDNAPSSIKAEIRLPRQAS